MTSEITKMLKDAVAKLEEIQDQLNLEILAEWGLHSRLTDIIQMLEAEAISINSIYPVYIFP